MEPMTPSTAPRTEPFDRSQGLLQTVRSPLLMAAGIPHGFSTRTGGSSTAYCRKEAGAGELNLGFTASDGRHNVLRNREKLLVDVFGSALPLVTLHQVHSALTVQVTTIDAGEEATSQGDGLVTDEPALALGIQTADCVPVLVADRRRGVVAAFHAGWRGTLARIVEQGVGMMRARYGSDPAELVAAIGPSIRGCCYSVGREVVDAFHAQFRYAGVLLSGEEPSRLDLAAANRQQLLASGLETNNIDDMDLCTRCRTDLFFSYREEAGFTGRMLSVIARTSR